MLSPGKNLAFQPCFSSMTQCISLFCIDFLKRTEFIWLVNLLNWSEIMKVVFLFNYKMFLNYFIAKLDTCGFFAILRKKPILSPILGILICIKFKLLHHLTSTIQHVTITSDLLCNTCLRLRCRIELFCPIHLFQLISMNISPLCFK